jgi:hypothetical protein
MSVSYWGLVRLARGTQEDRCWTRRKT